MWIIVSVRIWWCNLFYIFTLANCFNLKIFRQIASYLRHFYYIFTFNICSEIFITCVCVFDLNVAGLLLFSLSRPPWTTDRTFQIRFIFSQILSFFFYKKTRVEIWRTPNGRHGCLKWVTLEFSCWLRQIVVNVKPPRSWQIVANLYRRQIFRRHSIYYALPWEISLSAIFISVCFSKCLLFFFTSN